MNQRCFRVIFNRPRGQAIVVGELARTPGHVSNASSVPARSCWRCCTLPLVLILTLGWTPVANATIVADANAPTAQQPSVVTSPNGASPLVNIQTPNAAGISHNTYSRFDVEQAGAILNNSRQAVHTQLAGTIAGNPHLTTGAARIILNEVNSSNPSLLRGFIEVAGPRAHVVVANPSGIYVKGGGFINTTAVTLSTGTPQLKNGHLDGYRVTGGIIKIEGEGLDTRTADYTQIFAQAVQLNAAVHAKKLMITTGNNLVKVDNEKATPIASNTEAPEFALDVAKLGGMYADHIFIVGTENGVGMRNAGTLEAQSGTLTLTASGELLNTGRLQSQGDLKITATQVANGKFTQGPAAVETPPALISNQGHLIIKTPDDARGKVENYGQLQAAKHLSIKAHLIRNRMGGSLQASHARLTGGEVDNGRVNNSGVIKVQSAQLQAREVNNFQADKSPVPILQAKKQRQITASELFLNSGELKAGQELTIQAKDIDNSDKSILEAPYLRLTANGSIDNFGIIKARWGQLQARHIDNLSNDEGPAAVLHAEEDLVLTATYNCLNTGHIQAGKQLTIQARSIHNKLKGQLLAPQLQLSKDTRWGWGSSNISNWGLIDTRSGSLRADKVNNLSSGRLYGDQLAIIAKEFNNNPETPQSPTPVVVARQYLILAADRIHNREHVLIYSGGNAIFGALVNIGQFVMRSSPELLLNESATIDIQGDADCNVEKLINRDKNFAAEPVVTERILDVDRSTGSKGGNQGAAAVREVLFDAGPFALFGALSAVESAITRDDIERPDDYTTYHYDTTVTETTITNQDPAKFWIGGNLTLNGKQCINDKSQIVMGGDMTGSLRTVNNIDAHGVRTVVDAGTATNVTFHWRGGFRRFYESHESYAPYYNCSGGDQPFTLKRAVEQRHTRPPASENPLIQRAGTDFSVSPVISEVVTLRGQNLLPNSTLFSINLTDKNRPLIQTDPRLFNYGGSLPNLMNELSLVIDRQLLQRLGDLFYQQQFVRQQVQARTGHRFLPGAVNDTEQYHALVANGRAIAKQQQLEPGKALSPAQRQKLTQSIVWPVAKTVILADGSTQRVLMPKLYTPKVEDQVGLPPCNAQISAKRLHLQLEGQLHNSGNIVAAESLEVAAQRIEQSQGNLFGKRVQIKTKRDIQNEGGLLGAEQRLQLQAGRDISGTTPSYTITVGEPGSSYARCTTLGKRARILVTQPGGQLVVEAENDINLAAAQVLNAGEGGNSRFTSGRDINLQPVLTSQHQQIWWDANNSVGSGGQQEIGSQVKTVGNLCIQAGRHYTATGAEVVSGVDPAKPDTSLTAVTDRDTTAIEPLNHPLRPQNPSGRLLVRAGEKMTIRPSRDSSYYEDSRQRTDGKFWGPSSDNSYFSQEQSIAIGSQHSGTEAILLAEGDLTIEGSSVVGDQKTLVATKKNLKITNAENTASQVSHHYRERTEAQFSKSGLSINEQRTRQELQQCGTQASASTIGCLQGDVQLYAKEQISQRGSSVTAPQGDLTIVGRSVEIIDAKNQQETAQSSEFSHSGVSIGLSNPLLSAAQTARQLGGAVSQTSNRRLQALAVAAGGLGASNALEAIQSNPQQLGGVNVSLSISENESRFSSQHISQQAVRSQTSGRNITIIATDGDAQLQGEFTAKKRLRLEAAGELQLLASESSSQQQSQQSDSSQSVGIGFSLGVKGAGSNLQASLSDGQGSDQGGTQRYQNFKGSAGEQIQFRSGKGTLLQGVLQAPQMQYQVDGDFTAESLQDREWQGKNYHQESLSVSVSSNMASGSLAHQQQKLRSNYLSVQEQAGIKAGDGGFQGVVKGHTQLNAAVIASSQAAIDNQKDQHQTASYSQRALKNSTNYTAQNLSLGVGYSRAKRPQAPSSSEGVGKEQQGQITSGANQVPGSQLPSQQGLSATLPIILGDRGSASSTTTSGISGRALTITNPEQQWRLTGQSVEQTLASLDGSVTSDRDGSNALARIFNQEKQEEIEAGFQIASIFTREVGSFLETRAKTGTQAKEVLEQEQTKPLEQQDQQRIAHLQQTLQENQIWEMGGTGRLLMSAFTLAVGGNVTGGVGQLLQSTVVNTLQGLGAQQIKVLADSMNSEVARTALQGLLAGAGAAAQGQSATPAALGASASVVLNNLIDSAYGESSSTLSLAEREARKNLVTSLISGTTHALGGEAALANAAATIEMENNYLSRAQCSRRNQELSEGENLLHNAAIRAKWDLIDTGQDVSFRAGEIAGIPTTLYEAVEGIVNAALSPHETYLSLKSLFDSDNVLGTVSEAVKQSYIARLNKMDAEFEKAGASGSFKAGLESTKLIADIASLAASGIGVAKGGVALTNLGVKAAKQGIQSTKTIRGLATTAKQGTTATVPKVPSKVAGVSDTLAAGNSLSKAGHVAAKPPVASSSSTVQKQPSTVTGNLEKFSNNEAHSTVSGLNLNKSLASEAQLSEFTKTGGIALAGSNTDVILRDAPRLAAKYGGRTSDWSKVSSTSYKATDGTIFEIHAYRNVITGQLVEPKTIPIKK